MNAPASPHRSFLRFTEMSDAEIERALIDDVDRVIGKAVRQTLPPSTVLLTEGKPVKGIWIIVEGKIELTRRAEDTDVALHSDSAGRIVGLLAMTHRPVAFFSCRTLTEVTAVFVSWHDLDEALMRDQSLRAHFVAVLVRSLGVRVRHVVDLQLQINALNGELLSEHERLVQTLRQLENAQTRLIEKEKMATLGQLVAGVAHELNNPVTAIRRAADYVLEDVGALVGGLSEADTASAMLTSALMVSPMSTAEARQRRQLLAATLRDEALADRLLKVGITTLDEYKKWFGSVTAQQREERLAVMEHGYGLGTSLRNIRSAAERIVAIVRSLRSYARAEAGVAESVDVAQGLEDTLLLFGAAVKQVEIVRKYDAVPRIQADSGQLNQVWTNVIANALEAMGHRGSLTLWVDAPDDRHVRVRVIDTGPGIPPQHLERVFDLNFTTKHGAAAFGLGMGLVICRQIVNRHEGTIEIDSRPGNTEVRVVLPVSLSPEAHRALQQQPLTLPPPTEHKP